MRNFEDTLGSLADPKQLTSAIELKNASTDWLLGCYRDMLTIRRAEERIADLSRAKETKTPVHLGIGQEAVAVGVSAHLNSGDRVYSGHRGHSHYLAMHAPMRGIMAEVLGRATGSSSGMGGSMHLFSPESGFHGSVPIVGATIPIAVGAAIACKMDGKGQVAVCYFGDGACEEGVLHESLNLARVMDLPVLFVCENNLYSSHLDIHLRQPSNSVARFAEAHRVDRCVVDGNDLTAVSEAASQLILACRKGEGPGFLEAVTFRWLGHVGPNADIDVGVRRSPDELKAWKKRDPIRRLADALISSRGVTQETFALIDAEIDAEIADAVDFARRSEFPDDRVLMDYVYSGAAQ
ncbi:thiamine pyrophosphate-dependent dehydrogenase E1 component subunit alpha [Shinella oryzae]|uniref:Thiamine pyrophosphate-dependent dehydrogenase E1 component subunit alpha n=1 Tax=Shinella oryzae TaxID=2871820 RepID=A0ABY9JYR1_9HYPH|nr:thiamine pyrophosphate-dependent dehydrogenase E1 component subunit alpha [Shinella oryzae]WLS01467.1 thiamine pyrophosphate-dependent dehydrogenase E1 component subunit alpha [Shinella oryzae]